MDSALVSLSYVCDRAVTYPLHIILRFELESALFNGSLAVKDLPAAWNKGLKDLLGMWPGTAACKVRVEGCAEVTIGDSALPGQLMQS